MEIANLIYVNGKVLTVDNDNRVVSALAVKNNLILAVGSNEEVLVYQDENTKVIDLMGKTMIPGFCDAHGHFSMAAESLIKANLANPPVGKNTCISDYINALKEKARTVPVGQWIYGYGYDNTSIQEMRHPTRAELDQVSTEHPIWITHVSSHMGVANSKALEICGITQDTPTPEGGVIGKDSEGELNGFLEETAMFLIGSLSIDLPEEERLELLAKASDLYAQVGVTSASDGLVESFELIENYKKSVLNKDLKIRVVMNPSYELIETNPELSFESDKLTLGGVKSFADGSIQGYTAYLSKPYYKPGNNADNYNGYPWMSYDELLEKVKNIHNANQQCVIHGNGDAAIGDIIRAYRTAQEENPRDDCRHVIVHCQTASEEQLDEIKSLNIIPSFFALHTYYWGDRHRDIFLGPDRAFRIDPCKSALDRDIPFNIHCDTPVVPQNPLLSMYAAVNRISSNGNVIGKEQRISPLDALKAVTINSAYQNFEEKTKGSLEVGKFADLVILDENPLECNPEKIKDINVLETIVGGETVYTSLV
ncbi:hypothetical protein SAMN00017405_1297 [Desulfonispora thiosulfatigenes DSM 11270]|uniref:Amidohydrolase 3 domain-containing protein n=1 Tax=Desulfonispora thiosulfatigenes DSM 11270 TaxID=656914 RepID=A0A1W1VAT1_DESTI|nr:amidohydrolase [Desulfonispora thiosulfatigenes]SMB90310.1 hypothetical protein SAMN00017405_1297 [Desulfonispora thiosulfatigenes DSM 11270]